MVIIMKKLTKERFDKVGEYIFKSAAPIDIAWYNYNFINEDTDEFLNVLAKYQFDNGGFGGLVHEFE